MILEDDFLPSCSLLKDYSQDANFCDVVNEVDGVTYPHICEDIPEKIILEMGAGLSEVMGRDVDINSIFMRRSPLGVYVPNPVHSDASMGDYSCMLYLNDNSAAGTSLVYHKETGIAINPESKVLVDLINKDNRDPDKWGVFMFAEMRENLAFIFRSDILHRAEPIGGFGEGNQSRTVLTCFFS